nr:phage tail assembly protein [uncultured Shinella sp.]
MTEVTIPLSRPIDFPSGDTFQKITSLTLREMEAGDYFDASQQLRENASRAELEAGVAAICAGVTMSVMRKLKPVDIVKVSNWYDAQWKVENGDEDPSKGGAAK